MTKKTAIRKSGKITTFLTLIFTASLSTPCLAQDNFEPNTILRELRNCSKAKKNSEIKFAFAMLDSSGNLLFSNRPRSIPPLAMKIALAKAETANEFQLPTSSIENIVKPNNGLRELSNAITIPGGIPLKSKNDNHRGSIGVSGGTPAQDELCAKSIEKSLAREAD